MSKIPENPLTQDDFNKWAEVTKEVARLKSVEILLRMKIFGAMFPVPVEGTNTVALTDGYELKAKYPISRKILVDVLAGRTKELKDAGIKLGNLIVNKPELSVAEYRKLTEAELKLFDQILEIKPGTPQLEIFLTKRVRPQSE